MSKDAEIQKESTILKGKLKLDYEELIHKHIMEEIESIKQANIKIDTMTVVRKR